MALSRRIGLLPGTFDPIHLGHAELAKAALRFGGLDEVWLLVDAQPQYKTNVLSYRQRFDMVILATDGVAGVSAGQIPEALRRLPHTVAGFMALISHYPDTRFSFVLGLDMMRRLDTWPGHEQIVTQAAFLTARRTSTEGQGLVGPEDRGKPEDLDDELEALRARLGPLGAQLTVDELVLDGRSGAASSAIREQVRQQDRPEDLDPRVLGYIREHHLYR